MFHVSISGSSKKHISVYLITVGVQLMDFTSLKIGLFHCADALYIHLRLNFVNTFWIKKEIRTKPIVFTLLQKSVCRFHPFFALILLIVSEILILAL